MFMYKVTLIIFFIPSIYQQSQFFISYSNNSSQHSTRWKASCLAGEGPICPTRWVQFHRSNRILPGKTKSVQWEWEIATIFPSIIICFIKVHRSALHSHVCFLNKCRHSVYSHHLSWPRSKRSLFLRYLSCTSNTAIWCIAQSFYWHQFSPFWLTAFLK